MVSLKEKLVEYPLIELNTTNLQVIEQAQLQADIQQLQDLKIFFEAATSFNFEANESLDEAATLAKEIITNAKILEKSPNIIVQGYSDSVGSFEDNVFLSLERANYRALLSCAPSTSTVLKPRTLPGLVLVRPATR